MEESIWEKVWVNVSVTLGYQYLPNCPTSLLSKALKQVGVWHGQGQQRGRRVRLNWGRGKRQTLRLGSKLALAPEGLCICGKDFGLSSNNGKLLEAPTSLTAVRQMWKVTQVSRFSSQPSLHDGTSRNKTEAGFLFDAICTVVSRFMNWICFLIWGKMAAFIFVWGRWPWLCLSPNVESVTYGFFHLQTKL